MSENNIYFSLGKIEEFCKNQIVHLGEAKKQISNAKSKNNLMVPVVVNMILPNVKNVLFTEIEEVLNILKVTFTRENILDVFCEILDTKLQEFKETKMQMFTSLLPNLKIVLEIDLYLSKSVGQLVL